MSAEDIERIVAARQDDAENQLKKTLAQRGFDAEMIERVIAAKKEED